MRLRPQEYKRARIEIVPMIDTIFFLLVFFMIASLAMTRQNGMPVNLPRAEAGRPKMESRTVITLDRQGRLFLEKTPVSLAQLGSALEQRHRRQPDLVAVINADQDILWGKGIAVMDVVKKAGIVRVAIAVKPQEGISP